MLRTAAAILRKDLLVELRAKESVPAMALFSITTFVVFHFALRRASVEGELASGVLWVTLLFAAMLGVNRLFLPEREQGGFDAFLLAPVDRTAMLLAKAGALFAYLCLVELVAVPAYALLLLGPPLEQALPELAGVLLLANAGVAAVGTFVSAMAVQTRVRDLLVPLIALPLLLPALIGAARATSPLFAPGGAEAIDGTWPAMLALYDLTFGLLAYAVFDFLLED